MDEFQKCITSKIDNINSTVIENIDKKKDILNRFTKNNDTFLVEFVKEHEDDYVRLLHLLENI